MPTQQGSLALLDEPLAQSLLQSPFPARLAYVWKDGTPRVIPIAFHWNGTEIVLGTFPGSPKTKVLKDGSKVALTIDTNTMPFRVLMIRGSIHTDTVPGIADEYRASVVKSLGEEGGNAWLANMEPITPEMQRVFITPEWVGLIDFETRMPSPVEQAIAQAQASQ